MIVRDLEQSGYTVRTKLFRMKYYGIPQNRERVIFVGIRRGIDDRILAWPEEKPPTAATFRDVIGDLPEHYDDSIQHV